MHIYLVDLSYLELSLKRWSQCLLCPLAFLVRIRQRKEALTIHLSEMHFWNCILTTILSIVNRTFKVKSLEPKWLQNDDAKQTKLDLIKIVQPCWTVQVDLVSYVPYCPWIIVGHLQNQLAFYDNDSSDDDDDGCHLPHCSGKSCRPHALASLALSLTYCTGEPPIQARLLYRLWLVPYTGQARFRSSLWLAPATQKTPACHK